MCLRSQLLSISGLKVRSCRQELCPARLPQPLGWSTLHWRVTQTHPLWPLLLCSRSRAFSGAGRSTRLLTHP